MSTSKVSGPVLPDSARRVQELFARVARRYDLLNHLLSFNADKTWRRRVVLRAGEILRRPDARVLDLCCGTGDLMLALEREGGLGVIGSDFCHPMLAGARRKIAAGGHRSVLVEADALRLPLADGSVDLVTIAFGFRNLADPAAGLREMLRVLRVGGAAAILEFSQPPNPVFARLYGFYSRRVLPVVGGWISGARDAYEYLPESVRNFPSAEELSSRMRLAGFREVEFERMTGGIVALHLGRK
jgi:demethylmenaquinone methyltransferase/2-methoxy-6-polyprenyl-1,4-benzoquinol methylase